MAIVAGALAVILVTSCGLVIGMGGVGDLVARTAPMVKLAAFGGLLALVAAVAWTLGTAVGPIGEQPTPVVSVPDHAGDSEHGK